MSSIKDVARLAGVSYTTVSHVINGTRKVSEPARLRVLQAVRECAYVPSQVARSLRAAHTRVLGMLVPDISNPFCAEITLGVEQAAHEAGYVVVLGNSRLSDAGQSLQVERLLTHRVDAVLVVAGVFDHDRLTNALSRQLARQDLPVLLIDHGAGDLRADVLQADPFEAGLLATRHLTGLGHRRIACVSGPLSLGISQARVRGWRAALAEVAVEAPDDWVFEGDFGIASGHHAGLACLQRGGFSAVLACNDLMAMGVLRAAASSGLQVPADCSVMGMDGIDLGQYTLPSLSTVGEPLREVGRQAVQRVLERIGKKVQGPSRLWRRQPALIVRESTGPAPAAVSKEAA